MLGQGGLQRPVAAVHGLLERGSVGAEIGAQRAGQGAGSFSQVGVDPVPAGRAHVGVGPRQRIRKRFGKVSGPVSLLPGQRLAAQITEELIPRLRLLDRGCGRRHHRERRGGVDGHAQRPPPVAQRTVQPPADPAYDPVRPGELSRVEHQVLDALPVQGRRRVLPVPRREPLGQPVDLLPQGGSAPNGPPVGLSGDLQVCGRTWGGTAQQRLERLDHGVAQIAPARSQPGAHQDRPADQFGHARFHQINGLMIAAGE